MGRGGRSWRARAKGSERKRDKMAGRIFPPLPRSLYQTINKLLPSTKPAFPVPDDRLAPPPPPLLSFLLFFAHALSRIPLASHFFCLAKRKQKRLLCRLYIVACLSFDIATWGDRERRDNPSRHLVAFSLPPRSRARSYPKKIYGTNYPYGI